jgi:hypothetical protein
MTTWTQNPYQPQEAEAPRSHRWSPAPADAWPFEEVIPTFEVTFRLPADAEKLPIQKVEIKVYSLVWQPLSHTFEAGQAGPWTPSLYAVPRFDGTWSYEVWYQYVVFFKDGVYPDYVSPSLTIAGPQEIELAELGIRLLATTGIDFKVVPTIDVSWVSALGPGFVSLTAGSRTQSLLAGRDYEAGRPLLAKADYKVAEGNYVTSLPIAGGWNPLPFPFSWRQASFLPVGLTGANPTILRIQLQYENHEEGEGWKIASAKRQVTFDSKSSSLDWTFLAVDPTRALVRYSGTVIPKGGSQKQIPTTEANLGVIPVGDTPMWSSVTINASQVHWATWDAVVVAIYLKSNGQPQSRCEYRFSEGSLPEYWGYLGQTGSTYYWRATYYPRQGDPVEHPEESDFASLLTLPSEP